MPKTQTFFITDFMPMTNVVDTSWWDPDSVILGRGSGALTVCTTDTLRNKLGSSPEWLEPNPILSHTNDGKFLGLEVRI